ncbi:MAG: CotH kinase family protein, partial [Myxococcales bacterium]|nr:CotH kinase family protein [Myxococcales bacterium]
MASRTSTRWGASTMAALTLLALLPACGDSSGEGAGAEGGAASQGGESATGASDAGGAGAVGGNGAGGGSATQSGQVFFATDTLHHVEITVDEQYLDTLDNDLTVRVPATIVYDGETIEQAGLRKKGQSTLQPLDQKPSFSVKLDDTVAGQDIDGIERFALNNTVMDATYTSEPLSYLLYQRGGVPAPRTAHAVVTFNGEVKGIYVVVEAINKQFLEEHYGDGEGNLYEGP